MKKANHINSLDTIGEEISRLKLEAKLMEEKLDQNLDHLQKNYASMSMNSIFRNCRHDKKGKTDYPNSSFENSTVNAAFNRITDRFVDRAVDGIDGFIDRLLFPRKK